MPAPERSWACERGFEVKAGVVRMLHHVALGIALILAAAILSLVSPSLASAAAPAFVQGGNTQVVSGTTASLAFPGGTPPGT